MLGLVKKRAQYGVEEMSEVFSDFHPYATPPVGGFLGGKSVINKLPMREMVYGREYSTAETIWNYYFIIIINYYL